MPTEPEAPVEIPAAPPRPELIRPALIRPELGGHFARGALESAAHILGSTSASVFAAGLVLPYIAAIGGAKGMNGREVFAISALAVAFSMLTGLGAVVLRGLAHCAPHGLAARDAPGAGQ
jgi:hypothetical protein